MELSQFISHFNTSMSEIRSRLGKLENDLSRLDKDATGQTIVLRGPEGDVQKATEAAAKLMHEERTAHEAKLQQAISDLKVQQDKHYSDIRNEFEQFKTTALSVLERTVRDSVRELLVHANIIDEKGNHHPSMKGDTGATGPVGPAGPKGDIGPQGPVGNDSTVPGAPGLQKQQIIELIAQAWNRTAGMYNAEKKALGDIEKRLAALESR